MSGRRRIINASKMGGHGLRLIGTTDIDGNGTPHEIADVDPIVLFDFGTINAGNEIPFRPHPHLGLTAMSFLPLNGTYMAWDSLKGENEAYLRPGGLYYVHAGSPAFHHEFPSPETVTVALDIEFVQLVWNATDEENVETVIIQPEEVPVVSLQGATVRVLAGEFCGVESVQPFTHRKIVYAYIQLQENMNVELEVPSSMKGILFPIEGDLQVNDATVNAHQMMILGEEDHSLSVTNIGQDSVSRFIVAAGEPLNKPFCKLIGLGGFIIGKTEDEVRKNMEEFADKAEQLKSEVPHYFPPQYL